MRNRLAKKWQQMLLILNTQERSRAIFHVISSIRIPSSFAHVVRPDHVNRARDQAARTLKGVYSTKLEVLNEKWCLLYYSSTGCFLFPSIRSLGVRRRCRSKKRRATWPRAFPSVQTSRWLAACGIFRSKQISIPARLWMLRTSSGSNNKILWLSNVTDTFGWKTKKCAEVHRAPHASAGLLSALDIRDQWREGRGALAV